MSLPTLTIVDPFTLPLFKTDSLIVINQLGRHRMIHL